MSIKVLGGELKGLLLDVPKSSSVRPTSIMLRRKVFDSRQDLSHKVFVDLFAGSGAMGIEALSRGAAEVYLIDSLSKSFSSLRKNKELVGKRSDELSQKMFLYQGSCVQWWNKVFLSQVNDQNKKGVFFVDPPYENKQIYTIILEKIFNRSDILGEVWVESDELKGPSCEELCQIVGRPFIKKFKSSTHFMLIFENYERKDEVTV